MPAHEHLFRDLVEMKDTSELMVDLAYSALLYDNKEIAQEVLVLEEYMDDLHEKVRLEALKDVQKGWDMESARILLLLASSTEAIADAAVSISDVVLRDIELHPVIRMSLKDSDTIIHAGSISEGSCLADCTIGQKLVASETGMWILAIRRGSQWIYGPEKDTGMKTGDILLVKGPEESIQYFKDVLAGKEAL